jgi:hypothetical protein
VGASFFGFFSLINFIKARELTPAGIIPSTVIHAQ